MKMGVFIIVSHDIGKCMECFKSSPLDLDIAVQFNQPNRKSIKENNNDGSVVPDEVRKELI